MCDLTYVQECLVSLHEKQSRTHSHVFRLMGNIVLTLHLYRPITWIVQCYLHLYRPIVWVVQCSHTFINQAYLLYSASLTFIQTNHICWILLVLHLCRPVLFVVQCQPYIYIDQSVFSFLLILIIGTNIQVLRTYPYLLSFLPANVAK